MPAPKPAFIEGHEYEFAPGQFGVWGGKRGWMDAESYLAMKGKGQQEFDDKRALMGRLDTADRQAQRPGATGFVGRITSGEGLPEWSPFKGIGGTPGYDLDKTLLPVRSNAFIQNLQTMRNNSPTGGAVGNVSNSEGEKFASTDASLDVGQSQDQLRREIATMKAAIARHVPGIDLSNPIPLQEGERSSVPQGAYFTAADGKSYINRKGGANGTAKAPYDGRDEAGYARIPPGAYYIGPDGALRKKR